MTTRFARPAAAALLSLVLVACSSAVPDAAEHTSTSPSSAGRPDSARSLTVYHSPACSCCGGWTELARRTGWTVVTVAVTDIAAFKDEHGVNPAVLSCHTTLVGDYWVEGHVPFAAIDDLLSSSPDIDGIGLAGMPAGAPGMGGVADGPFLVSAVDGADVTEFGSYQ